MKKYVTYGKGTKFDPDKLVTDLNTYLQSKPKNAWWGSPIDAHYGWKDWAENNSFHTETLTEDNKIIWTLKEDSKILYIRSEEDLEWMLRRGFIEINIEYKDEYLINFYKIFDAGFSAVELTDSEIGHSIFYNNFRLTMLMSIWDCESIVVLDPTKIIVE